MELVPVLYGVPAFVTHDLHALGIRAALDFEQLAALQAYQPRVREVERNREAGNVRWGKPLVGQPHVRPEAELPLVQLLVERRDAVCEPGPLDRDAEIAQPELHQSFGGPVGPAGAAMTRGGHPGWERRRREHGARATRWQGDGLGTTIRGAGDISQPVRVAPPPEF